MTTISLAIVLHAAALATGAAPTYAEAHAQQKETGKPLVVLIGADWCPACQTMKNSALPQVQKRGALAKVSYAVVNTDQQGTLARQMMQGGSIPQLVMFRETADGWKRETLVGSQDPAAIEAFINRGLADVKTPANQLGGEPKATAAKTE
ncbi:MAG TPA: thioredoxin family protein [Pirellulales bacterium]|jgi:thioredoxin-like negative regulator of GroEL